MAKDFLENEIKQDEGLPEAVYPTLANQILTGNVNAQLNLAGGDIRSDGYVAGSTGWKIDSNGNVEFGSGYFRGDITGASGTFTGTITATTGSIGGFSIGADYLRDVANSFGLASTVTVGDDVRFWAGDTFANRATAPFRITEAGAITGSNITITGGSVAVAALNGTIAQANLNIANMGWTQTCVFSATDLDTVAWAVGVLTTANGTSYNIGAGNTGNMAARTYIYLDIALSTTAYQVTTTATTAVGVGKVLVATAINGTVEPTWEVFGGVGGLNIPGTSIVAASITTSEIAANTIVAGNMNVAQLSAISADLGAITAGTIVMPNTGYIRGGQTAYNTGTGFFLGYDTAAYKFSVGNPSGDFLTWDGTSLRFTSGSTLVLNLPFTELIIYDSGGGNPMTKDNFIWQMRPTVQRCSLHTDIAGADPTKNFIFESIVRVYAVPDDSGSDFWGLKATTTMVSAGVDYPTNGVFTEDHAGFIITQDDLYASVSDGTTQNKVAITGITLTAYNYYRIIRTGASIAFFVNGVLEQTLTTNLPDITTASIGWFDYQAASGNIFFVKQNWKYQQDL